jgi:hypothetical protein
LNYSFVIFFNDSLPTVHGVECPTCFNKYPIDEILEHADMCASHSFYIESPNVSKQYDLDQIASDCWNDDGIDQPTFQSLIAKARENMETGQPAMQRPNLRRKILWDDFMKERGG